MSLDAKTLKLLTAKDNLLEAQWLDARAFCYLEASSSGFDLLRRDESGAAKIAEGIGSTLPYAGQLVCPMPLAYLGRDGFLHSTDSGEAIPLPGPSSDLRWDRGAFRIVAERDGEDHLFVWRDGRWASQYSRAEYLRHVSFHPSENHALALSWPRHDLPWLSAELLYLRFNEDESAVEVEILCPPGLNSPCGEAEFSPSGDCLVASFLTDEYYQLWLYRFRTRNWVQLTFEDREHSSPLRRSSRRTFTFIRDGLLVCVSSEKSFWRIDTLDYLGHGHRIPTPLTFLQSPRANRETGDIVGFGAQLEYPYAPVRIDSIDGFKKVRSLEKALPVDASLRVERLTWSSVNGETIHGILYRDGTRTTPSPLILPIHGGPSDAVHATWPAKALAFVRQGYAVLYVNYRGSYGYGISYLQQLEGAFGRLEIKDLVSGVKSLEGSGWIDSSRVGLWGGGVASHTVLRALSLHPEVFAAGVAVFPLLDLSQHLALCPRAERAELSWALGTTDAEALEELSAQRSLTTLVRPLALFAGGRDSLVDPVELEAVSERLKTRKIPCWLTVYEEEGRSWQNHSTYSDYYSKVAGFFDRFLKFRSES